MSEFESASLPGWGLGDAKAQFSKVVRLAVSGRPQKVTVHGKDAVVVVSIDEFRRLRVQDTAPDLHELLSSSPLNRLEFDRDAVRSPVREVDL